MQRSRSSVPLSRRRPGGFLLGALVGLFLAGLIGGMLVPRNAYFWHSPSILVVIGLSAAVAIPSATVAYGGRTLPIPLFAAAPYPGFVVALSRHEGLLQQLTSVDFYAELLLATLLAGGSWGLAGGAFGYLVGTSARAIRVEEDTAGTTLASRLAFLGVATAIAVALLAWLWANRGLGDAI